MAKNPKSKCEDCDYGPLSWGALRCRSCAAKINSTKLWLSPEYRRHMSRVHKGQMPSNIEQLCATAKGNTYRLGMAPWNKDLRKETDDRVARSSGESHYNWKGGSKHSERLRFRLQMQRKVFTRDSYTCQICFQHGGYLQVDHIKAWAKYPDLRFELDNCRTLCMACHYYITFKRELPKGVVWGHNLSRRIAS